MRGKGEGECLWECEQRRRDVGVRCRMWDFEEKWGSVRRDVGVRRRNVGV